jgi:DNA-binding transcriptional regulator YiaG
MSQKPKSPLSDAIQEATELLDHLRAGGSIEGKYTIRTATLADQMPIAGPEEIRKARERFNASQALMAQFLGVSRATVRSWEQGTRPIPGIAARYLQDLAEFPEIWERRIKVTEIGPKSE